jgi:CHAT domain-containing protein/Tfp pilus assembly protein PilF
MICIRKTPGLVAVLLLIAVSAQRAAEPANPTPEQRQEIEKKAAALNQKALELSRRGELAASTKVAQEALQLRQMLYPKDKYPQGHPDLATSLNNLGGCLEAQGEFIKAETFYRDALAMRQALYPKDKYPQGHADIASCLNNLGGVLQGQGLYAKAEPLRRESLAMYQALYPKDKYPQGHSSVALSMTNLGSLLSAQGQYAQAEQLLRDALAMRQALYPKEKYPQGNRELALTLNNLGFLFRNQGDYAKSEQFFRDALVMQRALYPKDKYAQGHPDLALGLNNLGFLLRDQGEYAKAEPLLREALAMFQALYPKDQYPQGHPALASSLNNIGNLMQTQGENAKAETLYRDSLAMYRALFPPDKYSQGHPQLANSLNNLGSLLKDHGQYAKAEACLREALAMYQALYPKDRYPQGRPAVATTLSNLGSLFQVQGKNAQAEPFLREVLAMNQAQYSKEKYPQGHPALALSLNNLAVLLKRQGEYAKAEPLYRDAFAMYQALYPRDQYPHGNPALAMSLRNQGMFLEAQGAYAKAEPLLREALIMYQAIFDQVADNASEAEALNFAATLPANRDDFLSVTRRLPAQPAVYDLLWQARAAVTRVVERRHLDLLASRDETCQKLFAELQSARQRLARQLLTPVRDAAAHARRVKELADQKEDLEKRLVRQLRLSQPAQASRSTPGQLSERLPEGTAFIDFIRYIDAAHDPEIKGEKGTRTARRYVAFVLCRGKPAARVELGEAAPIDKAWRAWHEALTVGRQNDAAAATVARLVWQPLRDRLPTPTRTVWLAPDGPLTGVPWPALPGSKPNTLLLEEHAIALVPYGHFLLQALEKQPETDARLPDTLLAVGGIAYDQAPKGQANGASAPRPPAVGDQQALWSNLPGTERERRQIVELAAKTLKTKPVERFGNAASVSQVLEDLPRARYAHLATHGFFADASFRSALQLDEQQFQRVGQERSTAGTRSPLVLSGLVFAGANRPETPDRGILTAESVVGLRLDDLELAVLSACETGLGEVAGGEGVFGLTRAFHVAGTQTVVASLWHVPDQATQVLMGHFYSNLLQKKMSKLEALRAAQLWMLREYSSRGMAREDAPQADKTGRLPAYYWAAFMMSGLGK